MECRTGSGKVSRGVSVRTGNRRVADGLKEGRGDVHREGTAGGQKRKKKHTEGNRMQPNGGTHNATRKPRQLPKSQIVSEQNGTIAEWTDRVKKKQRIKEKRVDGKTKEIEEKSVTAERRGV